MTTRPVETSVSAATRPCGSCARIASRTASEIWSATLSGWPSETDSDVNRNSPIASPCVDYSKMSGNAWRLRALHGQRRKDLNSTKSPGTGAGDAAGPVENLRKPAVSTATAEQIERAAQLLHAGALIAFPTETVYGLGADARDDDAVRRIFAAKGRPAEHPVIVHLANADLMPRWARKIDASAQALARAFWPGPLTLILPRAATVLDVVTGGQDSVGLRVPGHPVAQALLARLLDLGGDGIESTIVDLASGEPALLRPGAITIEALGRVLGAAPRLPSSQSPRASG